MPLYCLFNFKTSENSLQVLQVTDVDLSLVQILLKTSENSSRVLQVTDVNLSLVQMQLLKTVYGRFPTTDAALLLIQLQDF